ncbi:MAG: hypothetical protein JXL20_09830 [Deltaproteobacteria bacterium]|nr:hypothetical protein [Deltaproteobacteria bacterium]
MAAFAGEGQKVLVIAVPAFHSGKAVAQVAAFQVPADDMLKIGTEESIGPLKSFFINLEEGFQIFDASIIIGSLRFSVPIYDRFDGHE